MRSLRYYSILIFFLLLMISMAESTHAQKLLGQWTFESGKELKDLAGNFGDIKLNDAIIDNGSLVLATNTWAATTGYKGPDIGEKTLVAWLYMDNLEVKNGAPIAIQKISGDSFDAITYAERQPRRFFPGSSNFMRTNDPDPGFEEKETGKLVYMVISYEDNGGQAHIKIYRNEDLIGDYTKGAIATWTKGDVVVIFGPRADFTGFGGIAHGWIACHVEEARIYSSVLSQNDIKNVNKVFLAVTPGDKLTTFWGAVKSK